MMLCVGGLVQPLDEKELERKLKKDQKVLTLVGLLLCTSVNNSKESCPVHQLFGV